MSAPGSRTVLVYGGERPLRLEVARLLREDGCRVLLASTPAEAAKAIASGPLGAIAALSPLGGTPGSSAGGAAPAVTPRDVAGHGHSSTDALAWREHIRRRIAEQGAQPTSSA